MDGNELTVIADFVMRLQERGAEFRWRDAEQQDWWLVLDAVQDMTHQEASQIAATALSVRDAIRDLLRSTGPVH